MTTPVLLTRNDVVCKRNWLSWRPITLLVMLACLAAAIEGLLIWRYLDSWISLPIL